MSVVNILDRVTEWARSSICPKITLKVPPESEKAPTDAGYEYQRAHPAAFTLYVPTKDKLGKDWLHPAPPASPIPSVCVRFRSGQDNLAEGSGSIGIELCFSSWSPGTHSKDIILPSETDGMAWNRWTGPETEEYFHRNGEGWRDAWNMVDIALREIESVTNIDGLVVDRSVPIQFGPLAEQEAIPDYYPMWFAWVSFSVTYPVVRHLRGAEEFL